LVSRSRVQHSDSKREEVITVHGSLSSARHQPRNRGLSFGRLRIGEYLLELLEGEARLLGEREIRISGIIPPLRRDPVLLGNHPKIDAEEGRMLEKERAPALRPLGKRQLRGNQIAL
jgi:hypothetical protein